MHSVSPEAIHAADTAWVLTSTVLVLLMTLPGIALFYAGMVRRKNVLNTMACVLVCAAVVSVAWLGLGYSLAFSGDSPWIGNLERAGFVNFVHSALSGNVAVHPIAPHLPEALYAMFQMAFAIITVALVVGGVVERMRFSAWVLFALLWSVVCYAPIAHWVWSPNGWLAEMGALDFAGGAVVHVNAGVAAIVCAWNVGRRQGYGRQPFEPANLALTMIGSGLLWIGWFGFNAGSALAADGRAAMALLTTHIAAATGALGWMAGEWLRRGRPTLLGLCSGLVGGLVAITPAAGFVQPGPAALIGLVAGLVCYWGATGFKHLLDADDSLDVFGVHGVGGIVGALLTGWFADPLVGGVSGDVLTQLLAVAAVAAYSAVATALVLAVVNLLVGLRVDPDAEEWGLDLAEHRERLEH